MFRRIILCGLAAATAALVAAAPAQAESIRIGSFLAVTGPAAFLGEPEKNTLEMYVEKINEEGGVLGRQLELFVYDTGLDAKKAVTFAKRLIEDDKVHAIVGGTSSGESLAVMKAVDPQVPFISLGGATQIVEPVRPYVFKTPHTDRLAVKKAYADMNKQGHRKVGLIAGTGGFDKSCMGNAKAHAGDAGIEIVADETYGDGDTDVTPQLTNIKNAGAEAILFCGFGAPSVIVNKNYAQLGLDIPLYHSHGSCSQRMIAGSEGAAEGARLPCAALVVWDQLPADDPQGAAAELYATEYQERFDEAVSTFGGHAYDALYLLVDAIRRAGSTDPEAIRSALEQTKEFIGVDGIFTMAADDHVGLDERSLKMVTVENGRWKLMY